MAKIERLVPGWILAQCREVEVERPTIRAAIESAERISREEAPLKEIRPFQEELQRMEAPQQLLDLLGLVGHGSKQKAICLVCPAI